MNRMYIALSFVLLATVSIGTALPQAAMAHRSGCHNLHTCPSDTGSYVCGDLGYPCNGATSINDIELEDVNVPLLVESLFIETFGRKPNDAESNYWKKRFRAEKDSIYKIRRTMAWHKANGSFGPKVQAAPKENSLVKNMNALFRSVYDGRNPTTSEHAYWISRLKDKPNEHALRGAMHFHMLNNLQH